MTLVRPKAILTFSVAILLVAASITSSDATAYPKRLNPPQSEPSNYDPDYNGKRDWDSSCFRFTGLPAQCACSSHGG